LIRGFEFGLPEHTVQCVTFTGEVAAKLAGMLNAETAIGRVARSR